MTSELNTYIWNKDSCAIGPYGIISAATPQSEVEKEDSERDNSELKLFGLTKIDWKGTLIQSRTLNPDSSDLLFIYLHIPFSREHIGRYIHYAHLYTKDSDTIGLAKKLSSEQISEHLSDTMHLKTFIFIVMFFAYLYIIYTRYHRNEGEVLNFAEQNRTYPLDLD